jgi:hypothetical protein
VNLYLLGAVALAALAAGGVLGVQYEKSNTQEAEKKYLALQLKVEQARSEGFSEGARITNEAHTIANSTLSKSTNRVLCVSTPPSGGNMPGTAGSTSASNMPSGSFSGDIGPDLQRLAAAARANNAIRQELLKGRKNAN